MNQHGGAGREKKKVLDIDFHFNDSRRSGGLGRPRRGGKREFGDKPRFSADGPKPEGERSGENRRSGPRRNERRVSIKTSKPNQTEPYLYYSINVTTGT